MKTWVWLDSSQGLSKPGFPASSSFSWAPEPLDFPQPHSHLFPCLCLKPQQNPHSNCFSLNSPLQAMWGFLWGMCLRILPLAYKWEQDPPGSRPTQLNDVRGIHQGHLPGAWGKEAPPWVQSLRAIFMSTAWGSAPSSEGTDGLEG